MLNLALSARPLLIEYLPKWPGGMRVLATALLVHSSHRCNCDTAMSAKSTNKVSFIWSLRLPPVRPSMLASLVKESSSLLERLAKVQDLVRVLVETNADCKVATA